MDQKVEMPTNEFLYQMIRQIEEGVSQGHKRLREDIKDLENRQDENSSSIARLREEFIAYKSTPVDITNISYTTRTVVAIIVGAIGITGSMWVLKNSVDDVRKELRMLQVTVTDYMINERRKQQ